MFEALITTAICAMLVKIFVIDDEVFMSSVGME